MLPLVVALPACWFLFIALRHTRLRRFVSPAPASSSAVIAVSPPWSLQVSTRALNDVPSRLLSSSFLPRVVSKRTSTSQRRRRRRLSAWFDTGMVVVSLVGLIVAQGVLILAAFKALRVVFGEIAVVGGDAAAVPTRVSKRAAIPSAAHGGTASYSASSRQGEGGKVEGDVTAAASGLLFRPLLLPGSSAGGRMSMSSLLVFISGLIVSQTWHEAGHALAAAAERIPLLSCGVKLYVLLVPVFYVELDLSAAHPSFSPPPAPRHASPAFAWQVTTTSSLTELRIATAGVWHNLVLALVVFVLAAGGEREESGALSGGGLGFGTRIGEALRLWKRMEEGVLVTAVDEDSALKQHLPPGSLVTHLDDYELDASFGQVSPVSSSPVALWTHYLSSEVKAGRDDAGYENLGWCLDQALFREGGSGGESQETGCCASAAGKGDGGDDGSDTPRDVGLCFQADSSIAGRRRLEACLDPILLNFDNSTEIARCFDAASCTSSITAAHDGAVVCARIADEEEVLRIRIVAAAEHVGQGQQDDGNKTQVVVEGRRCGASTIWWQGPRAGVLHQVTVTGIAPRFRLVPLGLHRLLEGLYSTIWSTSIGLAFFNLLPLPHLDGAIILAALLQTLGQPRGNEDQWAETLLGSLARTAVGRTLARRDLGEQLRAGARRWTTAVGAVVLLATGLVEMQTLFYL